MRRPAEVGTVRSVPSRGRNESPLSRVGRVVSVRIIHHFHFQLIPLFFSNPFYYHVQVKSPRVQRDLKLIIKQKQCAANSPVLRRVPHPLSFVQVRKAFVRVAAESKWTFWGFRRLRQCPSASAFVDAMLRRWLWLANSAGGGGSSILDLNSRLSHCHERR